MQIVWEILSGVFRNLKRNHVDYGVRFCVVKDVRDGDEVTSDEIRAIRTGSGAPLKYFYSFVSRAFNTDLLAGTSMNTQFPLK